MSHDVFISYKSEDKEQAAWVRENLEANGISCWMAPESIPGGSNYAMEIAGAMAQCRCVVVVFTAKTLTSMWVDKEVELALNMQKKVLPFMLEQVALSGSYQLYLSNVQQYAAYKNPKEALKELIRDIRKSKGAHGAPPKIVTRRPAQLSKLGGIGMLIGIILLVLGVWLILSEDRSLLLDVAPDNGTTTTTTTESAPLTDDITTTANSALVDGTTTEWNPNNDTTTAPSSAETATTGTVAQPTAPQVIGEAALTAIPDYARLAANQTNLSRKTAAEIPMNGMIGGVLKKDQDYWYGFFTASEIEVYRVAGLRVNGESADYDLFVTLYNEAGLKQKEIYIARNETYGFEDFVLERGKQYYVKVSSRNVSETSAVGYGLFVSPRDSDAGLSKEKATRIELNKEYTFELNSTLDDWFVFTSDLRSDTTLLVTLYNIDVGGTIELVGTNEAGDRKCSLTVKNEDHSDSTFYAFQKTIYFQIGPQEGVDEPDGTYMLVVTTYY